MASRNEAFKVESMRYKNRNEAQIPRINESHRFPLQKIESQR